jgi:hypothetical protein
MKDGKVDDDTPLMAPLDTLHQLIACCEETGECLLYFQKQEESGCIQISIVDPASVEEVRNPYSRKLMGFSQKVKGLPEVYFSATEMMKLKVVE